MVQEEGGQGLRFVSRPFISSELTHTYTVCATILNNNYYITTIHLTHRHELMGEGVFFFFQLGGPVLPQTRRNMEQHEECHKQSLIPENNIL